MKPRRTESSDTVLRLPGGTEDYDLWVTIYPADEDGDPVIGSTVIGSTWELTDDDRRQIADGANIELLVWGTAHPPVSVRVSPYRLGRPPDEGEAA